MIFVLGKSKISVEVGLGCNLTKAVNLLKNPGPINLTSTFNLTYKRTSLVNVNLGSLGITWTPNTSYKIVVSEGLTTDNRIDWNSPAQSFDIVSNDIPSITNWYYGGTLPVTGRKYNTVIKLKYSSTPIIINKNVPSAALKLYSKIGQTNTLIKTFLTTDPLLSVDSVDKSILNINVTGYIKESTTYFITISPEFIRDEDEFKSAVVASTTAYTYTTDDLLFPGLKSNLTTAFTPVVKNGRIRFYNANISSYATEYAFFVVTRRAKSQMSSAFSSSITGEYKTALSLFRDTSFISYQPNMIFSNMTPAPRVSRVESPSSTIKVVISSPNGTFGLLQDGSDRLQSFTLEGTLSNVNASILNLIFWPARGWEYTQTSYNMELYVDNILKDTKTYNLNWTSSFVFPTYTFTNTSTTSSYNPTINELIYGLMNLLVVGGGGGGAQAYYEYGGIYAYGSGGGAGQYQYLTMNGVTSISNITIGAGGIATNMVNPTPPNIKSGYDGQQGGTTSLTFNSTNYTLSSYGGSGGLYSRKTNLLSGHGGMSGNNFAGGSVSAYYNYHGAGGGGSSAIGEDGGVDGGRGGAGTVNSISGTAIQYCQGGWGRPYPPHETPLTTPGSGGSGSDVGNSGFVAENGQNGIVIIKIIPNPYP